MRRSLIFTVVLLGLLGWAVQPAASQSSAATAQPDASPAGRSDAAEKHAKRTACLKDAKSKKLVGAQKTAYLKDCMADLPPSSGASGSSASP